MIIDNKNPLLKNYLSDQCLGKKSLNSTIDQSSITSAGNRSLDIEQQNQKKSEFQKKKKNELSKIKNKSLISTNDEQSNEGKNNKIERDPMILLKAF